MAGGTKLSANNMAQVLTVTVEPNATPATTTSATAANHTWINLDRVISFSIVSPYVLLRFYTRARKRQFDACNPFRPVGPIDGHHDERTSDQYSALSPIGQHRPVNSGHS
jgi:hypothetical protein